MLNKRRQEQFEECTLFRIQYIYSSLTRRGYVLLKLHYYITAI